LDLELGRPARTYGDMKTIDFCSFRQTKTLVDYVRAKNPANLPFLWGAVQAELPENQDPEGFLCNPENRVSSGLLRRIMEQTRKATSDDMAVYKAALSITNGSCFGRGLKKRFWGFFGPKKAIQKTRMCIPFLSDQGAEILSISETHAVIRLHWCTDRALSSDFCLYAKGAYQAMPTLFHLAPARLWERTCFFKGGPWCEYEIWWDKQRRERGVSGGHWSAWLGRMPQRLKMVQEKQRDVARVTSVAPAGDPSSNEQPSRSKETVLLVDSQTMLLDVGRRMMEAVGYEVMTAGKGEDAVAIYEDQRGKIDMVVLDMVLPDMEGGEVYEKLKAINPQVKVLLSSAYGIDKVAGAVLAKGCDGFLQKPFSLKQLSRKMRAVLEPNNTVSHG
jgi:CheY-like chemotaxis protein